MNNWQGGDRTARHTHPNGMLLVVLKGTLQVDEGKDRHCELRLTIPEGESIIRVADDGGFLHFPHIIRCLEDSISLHLYSDAPRRGIELPD